MDEVSNPQKFFSWTATAVLTDRVEADWTVVFNESGIRWLGPAQQVPVQWRGAVDTTPPGTTYFTPGLIDAHSNGGGQTSFSEAEDLAQVARAAAEHLRHGTTTLVASLGPAELATMERQASLLASAAEDNLIAGLHFEGPSLGATPEAMLRLFEAARGQALSITISPERLVTAEGQAALNILTLAGAIPSWEDPDANTDTPDTHLLDRVRGAVTQGEVPLAEAVFLVTAQPAKAFGWSDRGHLRVGARADLLALNKDLVATGVVRGGQAVI